MSGAARIRAWREDPILFVKDNFKATPDIWQADALRAYASGDSERVRIAMLACAGPGKSTVLCWAGWHFLACFAEKGEHPKALAVSVTQDTLKDTLWSEFAKWQQKSPFLTAAFTWTQSRIFAKDHPSTWFLSARSFPKTADKETIGKTLSGIHGKYLLYLIDESGDIPTEIAKAAEQGLGETLQREGGFAKILTAGNPISRDGLLYYANTSENWFTIRITADPDDPKRTPRVSKEWAEQQIKEHGRDDPWVASYILGFFPESSLTSLLSLKEVELAMEKHHELDAYAFSQKRLGIDVALSGMDSTIIFPRQGLAAFKYVKMRGAKPNQIAARVIQAKAKWNSELEFVDDTGGFGSGVIDSMQLAGFAPQGIHFAEKATDNRYFNKRSEMWLKMAEWVRKGGALPKCNQLKKELTQVQYMLKNGRLALEAKDQVKKRLGFSPDIADALALTFALEDMPARDEFEYVRKLNNNNNQVLADFDPFRDM